MDIFDLIIKLDYQNACYSNNNLIFKPIVTFWHRYAKYAGSSLCLLTYIKYLVLHSWSFNFYWIYNIEYYIIGK